MKVHARSLFRIREVFETLAARYWGRGARIRSAIRSYGRCPSILVLPAGGTSTRRSPDLGNERKYKAQLTGRGWCCESISNDDGESRGP